MREAVLIFVLLAATMLNIILISLIMQRMLRQNQDIIEDLIQ